MAKDKYVFHITFSKTGCDDDLLAWVNELNKKRYKKSLYISKAIFYMINKMDVPIGNVSITNIEPVPYIPQVCVTITDPNLVRYLKQKETSGFKPYQIAKEAIRKNLSYSTSPNSIPSPLELEVTQKENSKSKGENNSPYINKEGILNIFSQLDESQLYGILASAMIPQANRSSMENYLPPVFNNLNVETTDLQSNGQEDYHSIGRNIKTVESENLVSKQDISSAPVNHYMELNKTPITEPPISESHIIEQPTTKSYVEEEFVKPIEQEHVEVKPIKVEPIKEEPIKEEPIKEEPIKEEPIKEEPIKEKPIKEKPIEEKPIEEKLIKEKPIEVEPTKEKPVIQKSTIIDEEEDDDDDDYNPFVSAAIY